MCFGQKGEGPAPKEVALTPRVGAIEESRIKFFGKFKFTQPIIACENSKKQNARMIKRISRYITTGYLKG